MPEDGVDSDSVRKGLSQADISLLEQRSLSLEALERQWHLLRVAPSFLHLEKAGALGEGISRFSEKELANFVSYFEERAQHLQILKFVPASGAASRMFEAWQGALQEGGFKSNAENERFLQNLPRYAFYPLLGELLGKQRLEEMQRQGGIVDLLEAILNKRGGLGYGGIAKALVAFHRYGGAIATPLEEQLREAALYCTDGNGYCRVHFTVAREYKENIEAFLREARSDLERIYKVQFLVDLSCQSPATDTIAITENGTLARDNDGRLLLRAGGHGALLENLQNLRADIIFIKNIDNIAHASYLEDTIRYKKAVGGYLLHLLKKSGDLQSALSGNNQNCREELIREATTFCEESLNYRFSSSFFSADRTTKAALIQDVLARPLRVCGVVPNSGEPGGTPCWVRDKNGAISLQMVEGLQINRQDPRQEAIWQAAEYFNPVDIVCCINDPRGGVFDLSRFADSEAFFITQKREKSRNLRVLEYPGLWNGAMAFWNSAFVEVPLTTFNPVKTVEDLLRAAHCEKQG